LQLVIEWCVRVVQNALQTVGV